MSSDDKPEKVMLGVVEFTCSDDVEDAQIEFMTRRLGYNRYLFIGYHYENCIKWANSYGAVGDGRIRISAKCVDTVGAMGIALILTQNDKLRRDVMNILNQHYTAAKIEENIERRST